MPRPAGGAGGGPRAPEGAPGGYGLAVTGMDLLSARLVPAGGDGGWLARLAGAVVFVPDDGEEAKEMISACLACGGAMELLGAVGSRLADPRAAPWPPFGLVAERGAELVAVVHGPVELIVEQAGDKERLYGGDDVGSWLNKVLSHVEALHSGRGAKPDGLVDLREGVVRAEGFLLVPRHRPVGPQPAEPRPDARPEDEDAGARVRLAAGTGARRPVEAESLTFIEPPEMAEDATVVEQSPPRLKGAAMADGPGWAQFPAHAAEMLRGVCCPRQHLNDPRAATCRVCGLPIAAGAPRAEGRRPPLGRLTWDNGQVNHLAGAVLVGRDVAFDGAVVAGDLAPLVPTGHNDSMSRVHAELRPSGWDVVILDKGSTNGTFVWDEASKAWQRLSPGEAHVLQAGAVIAFGERTATFEPTEVDTV